jgi:hypothetical protein
MAFSETAHRHRWKKICAARNKSITPIAANSVAIHTKALVNNQA